MRFSTGLLVAAVAVGASCDGGQCTQRPECTPVTGTVATFAPVENGCFLYSGGLDRVQERDDDLLLKAAVCNTCATKESIWLRIVRKPGADGGGDPFLEAERGGAALQHVPMVLAEAPDGMMVLNCGALRGPAVEQSLHRGPVEFPPSGELRHENRIGAPTRDDCVIQDCYEADGTLTSFGAETLFQAWPDGKREPSVTLAMVCQEAQIAGDVRALLSDEPQVRVELQLDPELSRELDTLDLYQ